MSDGGIRTKLPNTQTVERAEWLRDAGLTRRWAPTEFGGKPVDLARLDVSAGRQISVQ